MTDDTPTPDDWNANFAEMNEQFLESIEQNLEAQSAFTESWMETLGEAMDDEGFQDGIEGSMEAYEVWMDAAEATFSRTSDAMEGEDVDPTEFRDIWLDAANEAFKDVMATEAFAALTGQSVEEALDVRQGFEDVATDAVSDLGLATGRDVSEVGERLVELERRQHEVERKIDEVLDRVDDLDRLDEILDRLDDLDSSAADQ